MTTAAARQRIAEYGKRISHDAYLNMPELLAILYALPTTQEALDFLRTVSQRAAAAADSEKNNGGAFSSHFHRQRRNALKLQQALEEQNLLF